MITYPKASFQFVDVTALSDSSVSSDSNQDFGAILLFKDPVRMKRYGTMEHNQFILDGSRDIYYQNPEDIAYWSTAKSDGEGIYIQCPAITITFSKPHSSVGLTLFFGEDRPGQISVTWYSAGGAKLDSGIFYPDSEEYFCRKAVWNYSRIEIEFIKTSWPDRYVKMDYLEYGRIWMMSPENIRSANINEEFDPTSATLSVNTANIEIVDENNEFDLREEGLWSYLQKEQSIRLIEYVDQKEIDCGTFYLDKWDSQQNIVSFSLIDAIGHMDKTRFYDGRIYDGEPAGNIIAQIMESCGMTEYSVDEEIGLIPLTGWLGIQSHREALQQVVFACGAAADCSRSSQIRIFRPDRYVSSTIGLDRKFLGTKITLDEYVSGVSVSFKQYFLASESCEISKNTLPAGDTRIEFTEPYLPASITLSSGTLREVKTNYAVITMPREAECIITGRKYESAENTYTALVPVIEAGERENIKCYGGSTLMSAALEKEIARNLLDYHQSRQLVEMNYINYGEAVGNWCSIAQLSGQHSVTGILSQTLDLTGGNLASAKCRGYNRSVTNFYFAGNELYAGEQGI